MRMGSLAVSRRRTASKPRLVTKGKGRRTAFAHQALGDSLLVAELDRHPVFFTTSFSV